MIFLRIQNIIPSGYQEKNTKEVSREELNEIQKNESRLSIRTNRQI